MPTSQNPQLQKYPCANQPGSLQDSRTVQGVEPEPPTAHSPIIDIELRNPKGWQEAVIRRQNVAQGIAKCSLPVAASRSKKQWRTRRRKPSYQVVPFALAGNANRKGTSGSPVRPKVVGKE